MTCAFGMSYLLHKNYLLFCYVFKLRFWYVLIIQRIKYFLGTFLTYVLVMFWKTTYLKHTGVTYHTPLKYFGHTKNILKILYG